MGWWKDDNGGYVGDEVLDLVDDALQEVKTAYESEYDRAPTSQDLSALLSTAVATVLGRPARVTVRFERVPRPRKQAGKQRLRPGDVLAVKLRDGRYGLARILDVRGRSYLVEALQGIHDNLPELSGVGTVRRLVRQSFAWGGKPVLLKIHSMAPFDSPVIGSIPPSAAERAESSASLGDWQSVSSAILDEWRWVHDRDALIAEVDAEETAALAKYRGDHEK